MIPQEKSAAVTRGLLEAFGVTEFEDIRQMPGGLNSALLFRIVIGGSPFLLRIITRPEDPTGRFTNLRSAAGAGLAPRVWYTNVDDRISITDFVESAPFPTAQALLLMPLVLHRIHELPRFPKALNYRTMNEGFIKRFQTANILPQNEIDEGFARYGQIVDVYPREDADIVSCHNDLKPENIVFDGHRVWIADWEAGLLNDRYFDLAIVANFVVRGDADEQAYLQYYFGEPPDEYRFARFFLMRQVMHMFYAAMFLCLGSPGPPVKQTFGEFHRLLWSGEVSLVDKEMKAAYGKVHWEQFFENTRQPRFQEALRIVSDRFKTSTPLLLRS